MIPQKLTAHDVGRIVEHLTSLESDDRRLRFGGLVSDTYITEYVESSFLTHSMWFGCIDDDGKLVATCHAAIHEGQAELGCSVELQHRGQGLAQSMFDRAVTWLRSEGITEVFMHCLTENQAMKHIARKNDMTLDSAYGETDALVEVKPATVMTKYEDAALDRMAMYDMIYHNHMRLLRRLYFT